MRMALDPRTNKTILSGACGAPGILNWLGDATTKPNSKKPTYPPSSHYVQSSLDVTSNWNRVSRLNPDGPQNLSPRIVNFAISTSGLSIAAVEGVLNDGGRGRKVSERALHKKV